MPPTRRKHLRDQGQLPALPAIVQRPQSRALTSADLPDEDVLTDLGIDPADFGDFLIALQVIELQAEHRTLKEAADMAGISRQSLYRPKWIGLMNSARRLIVGRATMEIEGVTSRVFERWPQIVDQLVTTALSAERDSDKNDAAELIYNMYIKDRQVQPDSSDAQSYLKDLPSFAPPPVAIQAQAGATVNVYTNEQGEIINATIVEPELPAYPPVVQTEETSTPSSGFSIPRT